MDACQRIVFRYNSGSSSKFNQYGCAASVDFTVSVSQAAVPGFSFQDNCHGVQTNFTDNSSGAAFWHWDFGDNTSSSQQNPSHTFDQSGSFTVTQIVTSWGGCSDTLTDMIDIFPVPSSNFGPDTVCLKDSTHFTDLSSISSGTIVTWAWNFGDGSPVVNQQNPVHYYDLGSYLVTLIVVSDKGCIDDKTKLVGVYPLPEAAFSYSHSCLNEQPVVFSDSSVISEGSIIEWQWAFDLNAGTGVDTLQNPHYAYSAAGSYLVGLITTSANGCVDTFQQTIEVFPVQHTGFTADNTAGCQPLCIQLSDSTIISDGSIVEWNWASAPEGLEGTDASAFVCYEAAGSYSISLITTSDKGCKDSLTKNNYITVFPLPVADFSFSPQPANVQNMNIFFTDHSAGSLARWEWLFWDNDTSMLKGNSEQQHPMFDFAAEPGKRFAYFLGDTGNYPVQLIVTTINGCRDTVIKKMKIDGVFYVNTPNAFTPNDDGVNDYFFPKGIGIDPTRDFKFYIFDRWGDLIFESNSLEQAWDGKKDGALVQQDVYVWLIKLTDILNEEHKYIGHVSVIR